MSSIISLIGIVVVLILNVLPSVLSEYGVAEWTASQSIAVALIGGILVPF